MRILKLAIISGIVFMFLAFFISLLLPSQINISRSIEIFGSGEMVLKTVNYTEHWKYWVANRDSVPVSIVNTPTHKVFSMGSTKAWVVSSGTNKVVAKWQVNSGPVVFSEFRVNRKDEINKFLVEWNFIQKVKWYPWEKFALIASEKGFGDFMEICLENLKRHIEAAETGEQNL